MSANLDLVRSIYADWERGDFSRSDWADAAVEYVHVDGPSPGVWRGRAAMAEAFGGFLDAWEEFRTGMSDYRELDGEHILVFQSAAGRGKASGIDMF